MSNTTTSSRGTDWRRIITSAGFRAGFYDARHGVGFRPEFDKRSEEWQWWYEHGRLFAASAYSRRWKEMPGKPRDVTAALVKACMSARRAMDIPPTGADWT